tara:strand:- start:258 stop:488 length:231 start_codon:yes stop_codon:yes gene_type:complete
MKKLLQILNDIRPDIEFENEKKLVDDGVLDSFDIVSIISELNDVFDIHIRVNHLSPKNFNSAKAIMDLVITLQENT